MALIEDVGALLAALAPAGGVWYAAKTKQEAVYPYIVFQRVISVANVTLGGPSNLQNTRLQIDLYGDTLSALVALETALEAAMAAWAVQNVPLTSQDLYEEEVGLYRISKDFSIWSTS